MSFSVHYPGVDLRPHTEYKDYPVHLERLHWLYQTIEGERTAGKSVSILDVGCGTGNITIPLGLLPDAEVTGLDMNQANLDYCEAQPHGANVRFAFGYLQNFPIAQYDFIILTEVLEHIGDYHPILAHIGKSENPQLRFLLTIPNGRGPFELAMTPMYLLRRMGLNGFIRRVKNALGKREPYATNQEEAPHVNFFTRKRLKRELVQHGLTVKQEGKAFFLAPIIETYLPFIPLRRLAYWDNRFAQRLPFWAVSGWYFVIQKNSESTASE